MKSFRNTVKVFCAFCRSQRRVYASRRIGLKHIAASVLASGLIMMGLWRQYDPRVMIIFVVCLGIAEVFVQIRWRLSMTCHHCGFDPVMYKKHPDVAAEKVKQHLQRRKEDPKYLLAPALNLPTRKAPSDEPQKLVENSRGRLVSKQI